MAWVNAGDWETLSFNQIKTALKELCWAVNEREINLGLGRFKVVSLLREDFVATCTTEEDHGMEVGDRFLIQGCDTTAYNEWFEVSSGSGTSFTFAVINTLPEDAEGEIYIFRGSTKFTHKIDQTQKRFPTFEEEPLGLTENLKREEIEIDSVGRLLDSNTVVVIAPAHGLRTGDWIEMTGCDQDEFNGFWEVTVEAYLSAKTITNIATNGTVSCTDHGFAAQEIIKINGAAYDAFNGVFRVESVTNANTFKIDPHGGLPAGTSPSGECWSMDWFSFELPEMDTLPESPATGDIKYRVSALKADGLTIWDSGSGALAGFFSYADKTGLELGDSLDLIPLDSSDDDYFGRFPIRFSVTTGLSWYDLAMPDEIHQGDFVFRSSRFKQIIDEIRNSFTGLLFGNRSYPTWSINYARFVEGDYETYYGTIEDVLASNSISTEWVDLFNLKKSDIRSILLQIKEALETLKFIRYVCTIEGTAEQKTNVWQPLDGSESIEVGYDDAKAATATNTSLGEIKMHWYQHNDYSPPVWPPEVWTKYEWILKEEAFTTVDQQCGMGTFIEGEILGTSWYARTAGDSTIDEFTVEFTDPDTTEILLDDGVGEENETVIFNASTFFESDKPLLSFSFNIQGGLPEDNPANAGTGGLGGFSGNAGRGIGIDSGYVVREIEEDHGLSFG